MIQLNLFNHLDLTGKYSSLHIHVEDGKDISDEPRHHVKFKGTVYPYIPNSFDSSNPGCTRMEVYPKIDLV